MKQRALLAGAFALVAACAIAASRMGRLAEAPAAAITLLSCAGAAWLVAVIAARRSPPRTRAIVAGAVLLRLIALGSSLDLSDDVYRYVWEGELVLRGKSPYTHAPDDPALASVRAELSELHARVAHRDVPAVYPPLVQATGAFAALVARGTDTASQKTSPTSGVLVLRLLFTCADLLVLVPLARLLQRSGRSRAGLVAWAWCPLVVFEFAGSAHFDALGILLFLAALVALQRADEEPRLSRDARSMAWLAAAVLVKYLPLVVLPWIGRAQAQASVPIATRRDAQAEPSSIAGRAWTRIGFLVLFLATGFAPFLALSPGPHAFGAGLGEYGSRWQSGSLVFRFVEGACTRLFQPSAGWDDPQRVARVIVGVLWIAWTAWVVLRVRDRVRGVGLVVAGFLVLTPALHPWYLTWIVPFVALSPSYAWSWLIAAAPLLYAPLGSWQHDGRWIEPAWMWPLLALPFFALLFWSTLRTRSATA